MNALEKLVSIGTGPLAAGSPAGAPEQLVPLLELSNGFYAFESALHVFPAGAAGSELPGLGEWNSATLWRDAYKELAEGLLFFAEDVFGGQFALRGSEVVTFEPETGEVEVLAGDIEQWAAAVLADYQLLTGFGLAHEWQSSHGALAPGTRLLPKRPFVLGGEFAVDNLYALPAAQGMRLRGQLALQIRDLPDGATIQFKIVE